ncbi:MAG: cytochrome c biogenesis protein CcsA, partial [Gemmatimonadetes bacterium]|nr:cytochrome c biogenesis protein CcsA [Gemmatimonadota bacterium]
MVLVTGPLWAKPIWGIWWTWDARLTSTFVLWLLFLSYLILRSYLPDTGTRKQTLSAVIGILGFLNVPIVYMSIRWWRTQHPQPVIAGGEDSGLAPDMMVAFFFSLFVFTLLYWVLLRLRLRQDVCERKLRALQRRETAR